MTKTNNRRVPRALLCAGFSVLALTTSGSSLAAIPAGYYDNIDATNQTTMRSTLQTRIKDHTRIPYTSSATDTWDVLEAADENQDNTGDVITVYRNISYPKQGGGNSMYNREHTWPKSYGFPNDGSSNYPYTDMHHLFIADSGYNSSRSNKPYGVCSPSCLEKTTVSNNGRGGTGGGYPGDSGWTDGSFTQGIWETWVGRRGDVARALMYMDVRYAGGNHGITGAAEPDLILTDDVTLIASGKTGSNESVAYMGYLATLLQWAQSDPVDNIERQHTEAVYAFQGNRNPFVDHPEWVACVFQGSCSGGGGGGGGGNPTAPAAPTGLSISGDSIAIDLAWNANTETDLAGYTVYRSTTSGSSYTPLNGSLISATSYQDVAISAGNTYYYVITATNTGALESANSTQVQFTVSSPPMGSGQPWINEFHYDNKGGDKGEFIEIAGDAGMDLAGWQLLAYNGSNGTVYNTFNLSGQIDNEQNCAGAISVATSGLQNGAPDGIALIAPNGSVVEFISYEGSFTASNGAAAGMSSQDIGKKETSSTKKGRSLQLKGTGSAASDFSWNSPSNDSPGTINSGQTIELCSADTTPPSAPSGLATAAGDAQVTLSWNANSEIDLAGYDVYRRDSGGAFQVINGSQLTVTGFTDSTVANGTTYDYVITASDQSGNESAQSAQSSTTPQAPVQTGNSLWINELHYDNSSSDTGEFVEVAGSAGLDLSGWTLLGYNGNGGSVYKTINLGGTVPNESNQLGAVSFAFTGLQNGAPDGVALVDPNGTVVEFISYEGTMTATSGAANGMTSTNIGVSEGSSTPVGDSLQLGGSGSQSSDFFWQTAQASTPGQMNAGQSY